MTDRPIPPAADLESFEHRTRALADRLEATAELPIERATNRWLGEAEAVARDGRPRARDRPRARRGGPATV